MWLLRNRDQSSFIQRYYRRDELVRKDVYDVRARKVGSVVDVAFSKEGKTALVLKKGSNELFVPFDAVQEIGDIILLNLETEEIEEKLPKEASTQLKTGLSVRAPETQVERICLKCRHGNAVTARFCVKCGTKLA